MKNFVVSARKYRPTVFAHVVGQTPITTTLKNAIKDKQLAQAFLFCGPRGVGKTTCARILAKTINCQQVTATVEPCNTCRACTSFNSSSSFNVHELDAASNNSVEDIRALVEQVRYPPQTGQYKVYIIDEVHMLSNAAFNAFLKTLEEPPSYAIFILATTEKHKIIPTILSRCQIFDFHRIQPQAIVQQLKHIADQEGVAYEEEALHLISQKADGALRDALSMFDLVATFAAGQAVCYEATLQHLHMLDCAYYFRLTDALLRCDPAAALLLYDEILRAGFDGAHFITGLSEHWRNLMVCQDAASLQLLTVADKVKEQYQAQAARASVPFLYHALHITNQCSLHYKGSNNKRLHVELALIELAYVLAAPQPAGKVVLPSSPSKVPPPSPTSKSAKPTPASTAMPQKGEEIQAKDSNPSAKPTPASTAVQQKGEKIQAKDSNPSAKTTPASTVVQQKGEEIQAKDSNPSAKPTSTLPSTCKLPQLDQLKQRFSEAAAVPQAVASGATKLPQLPLTREAVAKHWQAYVRGLKEAGKVSEYSLLNQAFAVEDNAVVVTLVNAVQQDTLAGIQEELLAYLRTRLQRPDIVLRGVVVKAQKNSKPYTAQEKFKYLVEKYPDLHTLQAKLALVVQD